MLNSEKKFRALRDKKINILALVLSEKKILNETKNHNPHPPFKLNGQSLTCILVSDLPKYLKIVSSETTVPSGTKLYIDDVYKFLYKMFSFRFNRTIKYRYRHSCFCTTKSFPLELL